ncbi:MAG TPA: (2Fe-2S)-binding protein, partial [Candidatus Limnocylindria bacterium]|nr:(2Fe-2S)-binding protein [Candidatus Limnocylindria bacterium]
ALAFRFLPEVEQGHAIVDALWRDERPTRRVERSYPAPAEPTLLVCRCEEVPLERVAAAFEEGASAIAGLKKRTRACMGRCQGRVCEDVLRRIAVPRGQPDLLRHRPRVPARPIRMEDF